MPHKYGWAWRHNETHDLDELVDERGIVAPPKQPGAVIAWVAPRPAYCDRGHYVANVQYITDLDYQDHFPRYYMDRETAMRETESFLAWRLYRERL